MNRRRSPLQRAGFLCDARTFDFTGFDTALEETPGVDAFCSSSAWSESARRAFMPRCPLVVYHHGEAIAVFALETAAGGQRMLLPLDATWTLGSPLAAPHPQRDIDGLIEQILADQALYDFVMFSGMRPNTSMHRLVYHGLTKRNLEIFDFKPADRCVASLHDGSEAWLQRRSPKFRASARKARRDAENLGIRYQIVRPQDIDLSMIGVFADIEKRSWKGLSGTGLAEPSMEVFCTELLRATAPKGQSRTVLAYDGDTAVGFVFGAVSQGRYRGVQMSVDQRYHRMGLGNALQITMIEALVQEGVTAYDLGSLMPYKTRWADLRDRTVSILVGPVAKR